MAQIVKTSKVKGGSIARDAQSGQVVAVKTSKGVCKGSARSTDLVKEVSSKRSAALKRLANR